MGLRQQGWMRLRPGGWIVVGAMIAALAACGGGSDDGANPAPPLPGTADATGARIDGPDGARVEVPPEALGSAVRIGIAKDATAAPALPAESGFTPVSNVYTITPHGQAFAKPVTVTLPLDATRLAPRGQLVMLKAQPGGEWVVHTDVTRSGSEASIDVSDFSIFVLAQRIAEPFRFSLAVSGTTPDLVVTYQFSGRRPLCARGLRVQTVFRAESRHEYGERVPYGGFGQTRFVGYVSTQLIDQQRLDVPGGIDAAAAGHKVTQPMLPERSGVDTLDYKNITEWKPFVEGRVVCDGEVLSFTDAGATRSPQTWTYVSENMPQLGTHTGPVALLEDIAAVNASVGVLSSSAASVQLRNATWGQSLLQNSRWQLSRDAGTTWAPLANADAVMPLPPPSGSGQTAAVGANGLFRLSSTLPELPLAYDGALLRLVACVDAALGSPACAQGAPRAISVSAATVAPAFTREPVNTLVVAGAAATFSAAVRGTPPPALQWQRASGADWVDIAGATGPSYTLPAAGLADDGARLRVVATNSAGTQASAAATLNVVDQAAPPRIVAQSGALTVVEGGTAVFAAQVVGTAPLSYQWRRDGTPLTGANGPILRIDGVADAQAGLYTLEVMNPAGSTVGADQGLTVVPAGSAPPSPPAITLPPSNVLAIEGVTATFEVAATGDALRYQWTRNDVAIDGATSASFTTPALALADSGAVYRVIVYNGAGLVISGGATLTVSAAPATAEWRTPSTLQPTGSSFQPSAGIDDAGTAHAVWHTGTRTYASLGTGAGGWSAAAPIDGGTLLNGYESRLAVSSGGKAVAVWGYQAGSAYRLAAAVYDGAAWLAPQRIDGSLTGNSQSHRVAIDASGRAVAVWAQSTGSGYVVMGRIFDGSAWAAPVPLDPGETGGSPALAVNASGQGFVVWKRDSGELRAAPLDVVTGFAGSASLRAGSGSSGMLRVAVDGSGNAWAVWIDSATSGYDLLARRYTPAGGWAAATTLSTNVGFPLDDRFTVAGGSGGHLIVAWTSTTNAIVAMRWGPVAGWSFETLSTDGRAYAKVPTAAVNASGRISFVWLQADATNSRAETVARIFDGSAWGAPVPLQSSTLDISSTDQMGTGIAADGTAVAVWVEYAASGTEPVLGAFRR